MAREIAVENEAAIELEALTREIIRESEAMALETMISALRCFNDEIRLYSLRFVVLADALSLVASHMQTVQETPTLENNNGGGENYPEQQFAEQTGDCTSEGP